MMTKRAQGASMWAVAWGVLAVASGCGGAGASTEDAGEPLDASEAGVSDAGLDGGADAGPPSCAEQLEERVVELAPGFRGTQIHPAIAADADAIWVTLTAVEEEGSGFDVFLFELGCDGTPAAPIPVDDEIEPNDIDGTVAVGDETVMVAWQRDRGTGTITTWYRAFDRQGVPRGPSAALETRDDAGEPLETTHWFPQLVATEDGFVLVGSRGLETAFQVFAQRFDALGAPMGEAFVPEVDVERSQSTPSAAWNGALHVAFDATTESTERAVYVPPGEASMTLGATSIGSSTPSLARVGDRLLVAYDAGGAGNRAIFIEDVAGERVERVAGRGAAPFLAGGGLLWLEDFRGFSASRLLARAVIADATSLTLGPVVTLPTEAGIPGPYRPALVQLDDELHVVVWSEGTSPIFIARAAFVRLPRP